MNYPTQQFFVGILWFLSCPLHIVHSLVLLYISCHRGYDHHGLQKNLNSARVKLDIGEWAQTRLYIMLVCLQSTWLLGMGAFATFPKFSVSSMELDFVCNQERIHLES